MTQTNATSRWREVEAILRGKAYGTLDNDPQVLLEGDGGPVGAEADVIMARLLGFDDQIVEDGWRLRRVEPVLFMPIMPVLRLTTATEPGLTLPRTAEYVLQSGWARCPIAAEYAPPDVQVGPPTFTFDVLYVRYRRRS